MPEKQPKEWKNVLFLTISPVIGVVGTAVYTFYQGFNAIELGVFAFFIYATGLSITAGYHRYYSHRSYDCHPAVQLFFLIFGACAVQNSVRQWARDHRIHHKFEDKEQDPYNITKGFWHAHIKWIFYKEKPGIGFDNVPDLMKDKLVDWQHRWYLPLVFGVSFGVPTLIGFFIGRPLGGLLWGGFLRVVLVHHMTFFVNSLAHMWGAQPYSTQNTSRDSWVVALLTNGEGYHNFHHRFPADYRNGVRWYQWDPTKWLVKALSWAKLTERLCKTETPVILKATLETDMAAVKHRFAGLSQEKWALIHGKLETAKKALEHAITEWSHAKSKYRKWEAGASSRTEHLRAQWKKAMIEGELRYREAKERWRYLLRNLRQATIPT